MDTRQELRLGTRGSQLALWQANTVAALIAETGGPSCRVVVIKTDGDRLQDRPLSELGGKGLFVKELEDALLGGEIDLAVHSAKDMSAALPEGLVIAGVLPRENPLDALVLPVDASGSVRLQPDDRDASGRVRLQADDDDAFGSVRLQPGRGASIEDIVRLLGPSPSIGTGSVRRIAQLTRLFPRARFTGIRGNLDTRLRKLDQGAHDALVLAAAGLTRLGFASRISLSIAAEACVPAPGQGIVAIEIRRDDDRAREAVSRINDAAAFDALTAERAVLWTLGGGCQTPVGALASIVDRDHLEMVAVVAALDGSRVIHGRARAPRPDAAALGARVGAQLLADGAGVILAEIERSQGKSQVSSLNSQHQGSQRDDETAEN